MLRKKFLGVLAALAIALTGGLVAVTPSAALAQPLGCPAGTTCLFTGSNYTGAEKTLAWSTYHGGACWNVTGGFDTTTTSVYNDYGSGVGIVLYYGYSCTSYQYVLYAKTGVDFYGTFWDNHVRSFRLQGA